MGDDGGDGMFVVYRGGVVSAVAESRHAFLLAAPRGILRLPVPHGEE